jgi:ATP-dependent helicase HrpB
LALAGKITPLGREMASLPVHPRLGRLLVEGMRRGVANEAALAAALLSERAPFVRPAPVQSGGQRTSRRPSSISRSDVLDRVQALQAFESSGALDSEVGTLNRGAARQILRTRDQLLRLVPKAADGPAGPQPATRSGKEWSEQGFLRALLAAYPDRLVRRREPGSRRGVMVGGRGVRLADESALGDEELYVAVDVDAGQAEALVRQASVVEPTWLPVELLNSETVVSFDEAAEKVVARKRVLWDTLLLEENQAALPAEEEVARVLADAAAARLDRVFPADVDSVLGFRTRALCLAAWMPDLGLPVLDDDCLRGLIPQLASGCKSLADIRRGPWLAAMKGLFTWPQLQAVEREAPERIEVPSGSKIALAYEPGRPPVLAVRIQEVFGLLETPRVAGGRVPVLLHLLAPNMRVTQVTDDLASFWASGYQMVRKDLRARYPKHAWPEDPFAAPPQRGAKRRSP